MLIAPMVCAENPRPRCEVCRFGDACAGIFHAHSHFLVCSICCGYAAAALLVRVCFAQDVAELSGFDPERLA